MNKYRTLLSNTALIGIGTLASKLLMFFMVRFYTGYLSRADYGDADLIVMTVKLLFPVVSLGITDAVFRVSIELNNDQNKVFSAGFFTILFGSALLLLVLPALGMFAPLRGHLLLIAFFTIVSCLHSLCAQFIRAQGKTRLYALQGLLNTALLIALNIFFLAVLHAGITGYILSIALADLLCTAFLVGKERLWSQLTIHLDPTTTARMLRFSIPLIPTTIFWWITSVSDRYMITAMIGSDANGIYSVANKLPTILMLASGVFMEAWQYSAVTEKGGKQKDHLQFYSEIWSVFFSVIFLVGAVVIAFSKLGIRLLAAPDYYDSWQYVPLLCLSMVYYSFTSFMGSVYLVEKKSMMSLLTSMAGAVANIALNLLLIPTRFGVYGAAFATFVSYLLVFVIRSKNALTMLPFRLHGLRLAVSSLVIIAELLVVNLEVPGWPWLCGLSVAVLVVINRKPFAECCRRAVGVIRYYKTKKQ